MGVRLQALRSGRLFSAKNCAEKRLDRSLSHRCPLLASPLGGPQGDKIQKPRVRARVRVRTRVRVRVRVGHNSVNI